MPPGNTATRRTSEQSTNDIQDTMSNVQQQLQEVGACARQFAEKQLETVKEVAADYVEQGRTKAHELEETLETRIRNQPMQSILIAAGVGLLAGILLLRR